MRLLITRPEEDGSRLADRLVALGHEPVMLPLLTLIFPEQPALPLAGVQALIATSRNALRGLARNAAFDAAKAVPIYCVGDATAAFAAELGFADIRIGAGSAVDLAALITATARPYAGALLYLTGEQVAFDLASELSAQDFEVRRIVLYRAEANTEAGSALAAHLRAGIDGVILMSPRTAEIFAALYSALPARDIRGLTSYCYSKSVAKPLEDRPALHLSVAARPTETDLLALIGPAPSIASVANRSDELLGKS